MWVCEKARCVSVGALSLHVCMCVCVVGRSGLAGALACCYWCCCCCCCSTLMLHARSTLGARVCSLLLLMLLMPLLLLLLSCEEHPAFGGQAPKQAATYLDVRSIPPKIFDWSPLTHTTQHIGHLTPHSTLVTSRHTAHWSPLTSRHTAHHPILRKSGARLALFMPRPRVCTRPACQRCPSSHMQAVPACAQVGLARALGALSALWGRLAAAGGLQAAHGGDRAIGKDTMWR